MSVSECISAYLDLCERIFNPKRYAANIVGRAADFLQANGKFDSNALEEAIKKVIVDRGLSEDQLMQDEPNTPCKTWVTSLSRG